MEKEKTGTIWRESKERVKMRLKTLRGRGIQKKKVVEKKKCWRFSSSTVRRSKTAQEQKP